MKVQEHILSPRFGGPIIGAIHDHITGTFLLTYQDTTVRQGPDACRSGQGKQHTSYPSHHQGQERQGVLDREAAVLADTAQGPEADLQGIHLPEVQCLQEGGLRPRRLREASRTGSCCHGTIDEKAIGSFKGKILDKISRDYGSDRSREFLDNVTRLAIGAIMVKGFTTGIDDEDIPEEATQPDRGHAHASPSTRWTSLVAGLPQRRAGADARPQHGGDPGGRGHEGAGQGP